MLVAYGRFIGEATCRSIMLISRDSEDMKLHKHTMYSVCSRRIVWTMMWTLVRCRAMPRPGRLNGIDFSGTLSRVLRHGVMVDAAALLHASSSS